MTVLFGDAWAVVYFFLVFMVYSFIPPFLGGVAAMNLGEGYERMRYEGDDARVNERDPV